MKLLFDENLSPRLVSLLAEYFPDSAHIELIGMRGATDNQIWDYAINGEYVIVSKDNDFRQKAFYFGPPPKVIWLSVGNAGTQTIGDFLHRNSQKIATFIDDSTEGLFVLEKNA